MLFCKTSDADEPSKAVEQKPSNDEDIIMSDTTTPIELQGPIT
jgi:hypothetical protein